MTAGEEYFDGPGSAERHDLHAASHDRDIDALSDVEIGRFGGQFPAAVAGVDGGIRSVLKLMRSIIFGILRV